MAFSVRKSVRVGPLRFNLSTSGIGVSTGIKGFRVGYGPRGNYVHMGTGGLYYRRTLPPPKVPQVDVNPPISDHSHPSHGPMQEIKSGSIFRMIDTSSAQLLCELNEKQQRISWWPIACILIVGIELLLLMTGTPNWLTVSLGVLGVIGVAFAYLHDVSKKSVVILYELDGPVEGAMHNLYGSLAKLSQCGAVWRLAAQGNVYDPKYHAGAGQLIRRQPLSVSISEPPYVRTNIDVFRLFWDQRTLYFLPDRVLVYENNQIGALSYDGLRFHISSTRFIEDERVPHDAQVVDHTWRFVNKDGGPDKRFNNNHQIPVCLYEVLNLGSSTGLNEIFHVSRTGVSESLKTSASELAAAIESARIAEIERQQAEEERQRSEVTESQVNWQTAVPDSNASQQVFSIEASSELAALHVLCCVMVADGTASRRERIYIHKQMRQINASWEHSHIDSEIDKFILEIRRIGGKQVLQQTIAQIPAIKRDGFGTAIVNCLNGLISADDDVDERELILCSRFQKLLSR